VLPGEAEKVPAAQLTQAAAEVAPPSESAKPAGHCVHDAALNVLE
jgi:hypothetical protein